MREAATILAIIQRRGQFGLALEAMYRQLYNRELYLRAYARLYQNQGALTPGVNGETVDGMSLAKIDQLIELLRQEKYRWTPVRRVYIPKKNGKMRPLGIPNWSDKLLGEVIRSLLEAYYEPQFSDHSHGFRPARGCHSALAEIKHTWTGTKWFIELDLAQFFDRVDHQILVGLLREKIHDNRFMRLIEGMLKAGYLENWKYQPNLSGTPQGSGVSPVLANVYLNRLDQYVEQHLLPKYNQGQKRRFSKPYAALRMRIVKRQKKGLLKEARQLETQLQKMPRGDPFDPNYRRLRYIRYADDVLLGFVGPKHEAEEIKGLIGQFLQEELKLELNEEKTLLSHATTQAARFLGYDIVVQQANDYHGANGSRTVNGKIGLRVPGEVVEKLCQRYMQHGKAAHRNRLLHESDFSIVAQYGAEWRGVVNYYLMAQNVGWLWKLHWVMKTSLLRTLAGKHKTTLSAMAKKYSTTIKTEHGTLKCVEVVVEREGTGTGKAPLIARFGGLHLRPERKAEIKDSFLQIFVNGSRSELIQRLLADKCEVCGSQEKVEVHHLRRLSDLKQPGRKAPPRWVEEMVARRRKTLAVCSSCHDAIHARSRSEKPKLKPEPEQRKAEKTNQRKENQK